MVKRQVCLGGMSACNWWCVRVLLARPPLNNDKCNVCNCPLDIINLRLIPGSSQCLYLFHYLINLCLPVCVFVCACV